MATADEQIIVGGQRAVAVSEVSGDYLYDGGATDIQCVVKDGDTAQRAIKVLNVDGGGTPLFKKIIIKDTTIPTASAANANEMYIYAGETNSTYTHGYIYENKYLPNYSGTITFSPAGISVSDANFSSFLNKWKQYLTTPTLVTNGTITYHGISSLWKMVMKDANNQQIGTLQLYQSDYEDSGFTFPADPQDGDEYTFTTTITESSSSYQWVRIDVQPGGGSVKFVQELPAQGEEKYIYGVVLEETTREGYGIIQLFMWYNNAWYAAGAFDVDIDPTQLLYKSEVGDYAYTPTNLVAGNGLTMQNKAASILVSNFSAANFLRTNFTPGTVTSFEYISKWITPSSFSASNDFPCLFGDGGTQTNLLNNPSIAWQKNSSQIGFSIPSSSSSWGNSIVSSTSWATDTAYWIKATWDGSTSYLYRSVNGTDYTLLGTASNSAAYFAAAPCIGNNYGGTLPFFGTVDLAETIIKINGVTVFDGSTALSGEDYIVVGSPTIEVGTITHSLNVNETVVATLDSNGQIKSGQINYATSSRVGGIRQSFDSATGTLTIITEDL